MGGVGGYFGGVLAQHGADTTFLVKSEHLRRTQSVTLRVQTVDGNFTLSKPQVVETLESDICFDVILVCVKYYDLDAVAKIIAPGITPKTVVLTVQNGIDADREVLRWLEQVSVYPGSAHIISTLKEPGQVVQSGGPRTLVFGARAGGAAPRLEQSVRYLRAHGVQASVSENIERELWFKFIFALGFSGLTAVYDQSFQEIYSTPLGKAEFLEVIAQGCDLAGADGVRFKPSERLKLVERADSHLLEAAPATSSLQRDLRQGRRSEVEALHGTALRYARKYGLSLPAIESIYQRILARASVPR